MPDNVTPGSRRKGWKISPDAHDRIRDNERRERGWQSPQEEQRAQRRAEFQRLPRRPYRPRTQRV